MTAIKWPNDILAGGRKLAGILAEASGELGRAEQVVLGIGLNVNQIATDFPADVRQRATSLRLLIGQPVRRVPILQGFLEEFEELYAGIRRHGYHEILAEATAHSATLGRRVRVIAGSSVVVGTALHMDPDGALVVETGSGPKRVLTGETEEVGCDA